MNVDTYIITLWEAVELLEEILIKHFTEENKLEIVKELQSKKNWQYIYKYANYSVSDQLSVKFRAINKTFPKVPKKKIDESGNDPEKTQKGRPPDTYSKLVYSIRQEVNRGVEVHLNNNQLDIILNYLNKPDEKVKYRSRLGFNPQYDFRYNFMNSTWILYTWDYSFDEDYKIVSGLRKSILRFTNLFRVTFETYRVRENKTIPYTGDFIRVGDYLKIRITSSAKSVTWEEDLTFMFYIGNEKVDLALGHYRRIDAGSLTSGTAIMQRESDDITEQIEPRFDAIDSDMTTNKMIINYLKEKNKNYMKSPKITSIAEFSEWFYKQKKIN